MIILQEVYGYVLHPVHTKGNSKYILESTEEVMSKNLKISI